MDQLSSITRQRDKALNRAKQARSQEDEYFEENSHLEQQEEATNAKLAEVSAIANSSRDENNLLKQQVEDARSEESQEKANSHAAWVENQGQLMQARRDLQDSQNVNVDLQTQLRQAQALLSDKERQKLGLPPLKKPAAAKAQKSPTPP